MEPVGMTKASTTKARKVRARIKAMMIASMVSTMLAREASSDFCEEPGGLGVARGDGAAGAGGAGDCATGVAAEGADEAGEADGVCGVAGGTYAGCGPP